MPCPACGGLDRVSVASDSFVCTSHRVVGGVPPGQGGNLSSVPIPIFETCGHRYTVADEQRVLATARARAEEQQKLAAQQQRQAVEALERWRVALDEWLSRTGDPIERNLHLARFGERDIEIPGLGPWFVEQARTRAVSPGRVPRVRKTIFGGWKRYYEPGWVFIQGSTRVSPWNEDTSAAAFAWGVVSFCSIALNTKAEWLYDPSFDPVPVKDGERYSIRVLHEMAKLLDLAEPPPRPDGAPGADTG